MNLASRSRRLMKRRQSQLAPTNSFSLTVRLSSKFSARDIWGVSASSFILWCSTANLSRVSLENFLLLAFMAITNSGISLARCNGETFVILFPSSPRRYHHGGNWLTLTLSWIEGCDAGHNVAIFVWRGFLPIA